MPRKPLVDIIIIEKANYADDKLSAVYDAVQSPTLFLIVCATAAADRSPFSMRR